LANGFLACLANAFPENTPFDFQIVRKFPIFALDQIFDIQIDMIKAHSPEAKEASKSLGESSFDKSEVGQSKTPPSFQLKAAEAASGKKQPGISTWGGDFRPEVYHAIDSKEEKAKHEGEMVGLHMELHFEPGEQVDAQEIAMLQTAKTIKEGEPMLWSPTDEARGIPLNEAGAGTKIDSSDDSKNPLYGVTNTPYTDKALTDSPVSSPGYGEHGYHYTSENGKPLSKSAILIDLPGFRKPTKNAQQTFESSAIAIKGKQEGAYYGSVSWGWETDAEGKFKVLPVVKASDGTPTRNFLAASKRWNESTSNRGTQDIPLPLPKSVVATLENTELYDAPTGGKSLHQLAAGSRLDDLGERSNGMAKVKVIDGSGNHDAMYKTGWVSESLIQSER
jgi:hypothetical protein